MHNDIHAPPLEKLYRALADIFDVCGARRDDVDDAQDLGFGGSMLVIVIVVVVMVVRRSVGVCVCMVVRVGMFVVMVMIVGVLVLMFMVVVMVMVVLVSAAVFLFCVDFGVCGAFVFEPELGHCIADDAAQSTQFSERVSDAVLDVVGQAEHEACSAGFYERDGREEDQYCDDA